MFRWLLAISLVTPAFAEPVGAPPPSSAPSEASQTIATQIGNLVMNNAQLAAQLHECQQKQVPPPQDNH